MKKDKILKIFIFSIILLIVIGGTYAYWTWNSTDNKNVVFSTAGLNDYVIYDEGESYFVGDYQPYDAFCESVHTTISIYKTSDALNMDLRATIKMDVNSIGDNISLSDNVYYVVTSGDSNITCNNGLSGSNVIASGSFKGVSTDETLDLVNNIEVTTEEEKYTVWIWIDASGDDISSLSLETLDTNIWTLVDMIDGSSINSNDIVNVVVNDGMIPVTISDDGVVTTISKNDNNWYDYDNKEWANAILVTNSSRGNYLNTSGVEVQESDILAYYVWIPRYKYKIWTTSVSSTGKEQTIDIVFENKETPKSNGTEVGEYLTHPAFTFGDQELDGFWVGKFETTGTGDNPSILPNVQSLTNQNVSTQFETSLKFAGGTFTGGVVSFSGSTTYGLTNNTNSHMMKNSEWGAVAYLSHSIYGINKKIRLNNNSSYMTGCGASVQSNNSSSASCRYAFGSSLEYPQTTTGNITGIYDMSGGSAEYVMGNYASIADRSGFTIFPSKKYYDEYSSNVFVSSNNSLNFNYCTILTCGGQALFETKNWYDEFSDFIHSGGAWFVRGGYQTDNTSAGIFFSDDAGGGSYSTRSWRSVLTYTKYVDYYILKYDANGGNGAPNVQEVTNDDSYVAISSIVPVREGYKFLNWNTQSDGSGTTYRAGDLINVSSNITLYAIWQELLTPTLTTSVSTLNIKMTSTGTGSFTYTYNGDGEISCTSSNTSIATCSVSGNVVYVTAKSTGDTTITLNSTSTSTYTATSASVSINVSLQTYTISYDANGGSGAPANQSKTYGVTLTLSNTVPTRSGYTFLGWSTSSSATSAIYSAGGSYTSNSAVTLYAVWYAPISIPTFTYTGTYKIVDDDDNEITNTSTYTGNWKIRFLTDGTLTITDLKGAANGIDIFLVGGGGTGGTQSTFCSSSPGAYGGGGGAAITVTNFPIAANTAYTLDIGAASANTVFKKGTTAYYTALCGGNATNPDGSGSAWNYGTAGAGGAGRLSTETSNYGAESVVAVAGASGGSDGNYEFFGTSGKRYGAGGGRGALGKASTTCASEGYSGSSGGADGGGSGGTGGWTKCLGNNEYSYYEGKSGSAGTDNTGSGGGGGGGALGSGCSTRLNGGSGGSGGTGIIIIRNHR